MGQVEGQIGIMKGEVLIAVAHANILISFPYLIPNLCPYRHLPFIEQVSSLCCFLDGLGVEWYYTGLHPLASINKLSERQE